MDNKEEKLETQLLNDIKSKYNEDILENQTLKKIDNKDGKLETQVLND